MRLRARHVQHAARLAPHARRDARRFLAHAVAGRRRIPHARRGARQTGVPGHLGLRHRRRARLPAGRDRAAHRAPRRRRVKRRDFVAAALATAAWGAYAAPSRGPSPDFDAMWEAIDAGYAYFDPASRARWRAVRERLRGPAGRAATPAAFAGVIESALAELRDDHVTLGGATVRGRR